MTSFMNSLYALTHSVIIIGAVMFASIELALPTEPLLFKVIATLVGLSAIAQIILTTLGFKLCPVHH